MISCEISLSTEAKKYKQADEQAMLGIVNGYYNLIGHLINIEKTDKAEINFVVAFPIVKILTNLSPNYIKLQSIRSCLHRLQNGINAVVSNVSCVKK